MKKTLYLFFFIIFLSYSFSLAQTTNKTTNGIKSNEQLKIDQKLKKIKSSTTLSVAEKEKSLGDLKSESKKISYYSGVLNSGNLLLEIYLDQNKFKEAIDIGNELKDVPRTKEDSRTIVNIYRKKALALGYLGFYDSSVKDFQTAIKLTENIEDANISAFLRSLCYENLTVYYNSKHFEEKKYRDSILYYTKKSLDLAIEIQDNNPQVTNTQKYNHILFSYMRLGIFYLEQAEQQGSLNLADKYLHEALKINENETYNIPKNNQIMLLNQLSWLYVEKKDYPKAIDFANRALELEKTFKDPYHRVESFEFLATSHLETGENEKSKFYMTKFNFLKDSLRIAEKNSTDDHVDQIIATVDEKHEKSTHQKILITATIALFLMVCFYIFWKRKNKLLNQKYELLIQKFENQSFSSIEHDLDENDFEESDDVLLDDVIVYEENTKESEKQILHITDDTSKILLQKIEKFEKSEKYLKKEANLTYMASYIGTNTKYLSEIIKLHKGKTFNSYLNGLRVEYIVRELYSNPKLRDYKISHLAEISGFSSREVFAVIFKKETKITPSFFINKLKAEQYKSRFVKQRID